MRDFLKSEKNKRLFIAFGVTFMVTLVTFTIIFISYSQKIKSTSDSLSSITNTTVISNNEVINEESLLASSSEDKDVNEVLNEVINNIDTQTESVQGETSNTVSVDNIEVTENEDLEATEENIEENIEEVEPVSFIAPVSGEIITDYAEESLIFSNTLQEWTTHLGIDIKADKASVVVASEDGVIKSIKNDPRYGLTITISHNDNFETAYSNLLSSEFVNEGDEVKQGQTIGTVGESASFEVAEVPHLHFEMYKDGSVVNPTLYLEDL